MTSTEFPLLSPGDFRIEISQSWISGQVIGSGPSCIVCPASWGVSSKIWKTFNDLARFVTLIIFDPRGVGDSGPVQKKSDYGISTLVSDLEHVRKHFNLDRWHILGQSAGGFTALRYALEYQERCSSLMIICSAPSGFFHKGTIRNKSHPRYPEIQTVADNFRQEFTKANMRRYMRAVYAMDAQTQEARQEIDTIFSTLDISIERYRYFIGHDLSHYNVIDSLSSIHTPALVMGGKFDIHVSPAHSETMAQQIPGARYILMEHSGHFPWLDEPELFATTIADFISSNS
jgi:proline iminopeptidase